MTWPTAALRPRWLAGQGGPQVQDMGGAPRSGRGQRLDFLCGGRGGFAA